MKKILLLPGDGIGPEIMAEAEKVLSLLQAHAGLEIIIERGLLGGCAVDATGEPYPEETRRQAKMADAILLASVGGPKWDTLPRQQRPETGLLAIRADLELFANLRPAQVMDSLVSRSALKAELVSGLDILIVRELTGGIYFGQPRGLGENAQGEREGYNTLRYSESEVRRIAKIAFDAAMQRQKRLCSIDKMNVLESSQLWREIVQEMAAEYPEVVLTHMLIDNAAMQLVRDPQQFDVIVTGNLFGDILSDEASMLTGSIGLLPSASLRSDGVGLFEPIHGSAPDIAGKNIANPYAMILSVAMMLRYTLNEVYLAQIIEDSVKICIKEGICSADIVAQGQQIYRTNEIGDAVCRTMMKMLKENF
ncbi:MAG: 3-isopropylmalate dehydrogenase [Cardiobacteriaceae bacterium]|nr:3-isopropylmalate dehydrogenase [Cardiobacteriaceae bacterium]